MRLLVTGGAGYIGSVTADHLLQAGHDVVVLDNLGNGHREAVPEQVEFVEGDIHDRALLKDLFLRGFDGVLHFAAFIEAGESMVNPSKFFENNVIGSHVLLSEVINAKVPHFIFSSTAAVYKTKDELLTETDEIQPVNVYGQTKRMIEEMLEWYSATLGLKSCIFRYFNAAGASMLESPPKRGEQHDPESHIIPNILKTAKGERESFRLFGKDYPTPDGTCVRDYIHVDDLANAHVLGLEKLVEGAFDFEVFNLGNGLGFSNMQVVETARNVTGQEIQVTVEVRREGDAPRLVASSQKAKDNLGWQPQYPDLETIISSAWEWEKSV